MPVGEQRDEEEPQGSIGADDRRRYRVTDAIPRPDAVAHGVDPG